MCSHPLSILSRMPEASLCLERAFPSVSWRLGKRGSASQDMKTERVVAARAEHRGTNSWPWELELNRKKERSSHWYSFASFPLIANSLKTKQKTKKRTNHAHLPGSYLQGTPRLALCFPLKVVHPPLALILPAGWPVSVLTTSCSRVGCEC